MKIENIVSNQKQQSHPEVKKVTVVRKKSTADSKVKNTSSIQLTGGSIEQKVMKLLNSMQVVSEQIDVEMSNLNIHLPEITVKHSSDTIQYKWIIKAEEKIREK